jgi:hypothetical protein
MPANKLMFSLFVTAMLVLPAGMANAGDLNIQTSNVQMELDDDGGIFIRTAPVSPVIVNPVLNPTVNQNIYRNRRMRVIRGNTQMKCRNVTQRRNTKRGGSQIYTSNSTTVCN